MRNLKGLFADKPAATQGIALVLMVVFGMFISSFLGSLLLLLRHGTGVSLLDYPDDLRTLQFLSSIGVFLLPALAVAWLYTNEPRQYLSVGKCPGIKVWFYLLLIYILFTPVMNVVQYMNQQLVLPEFMRPLEEWMRTEEDRAEQLVQLLIGDSRPMILLLNLLVMAVTAAVAEEFFFRGAVQRILGSWSANPHMVVWVTALAFSAIHLQFYGFVPRLLIGAYLGYLLLWSGNIWVPVLAHFINNCVAVIGMSSDRLKAMEYFNGDLSPEYMVYYILAAVAATLILIPVLRQLRKELSQAL